MSEAEIEKFIKDYFDDPADDFEYSKDTIDGFEMGARAMLDRAKAAIEAGKEKENERIKEVINSVSLTNNDLGKHGDGFEKAIDMIFTAMNWK